MKVDDLPSDEKLQWPDLPAIQLVQIQFKHALADDADHVEIAPLNVSERLVNPLVNLITVPGVRLASTVSAEVRVFQDGMRAVAARNPQAVVPSFQGDYLVLRLAHSAGSVLTLHRVVHSIFMQDAVKQNATFTTL
eukprot:929576-Pleurochrysis_carterae.AAC.1